MLASIVILQTATTECELAKGAGTKTSNFSRVFTNVEQKTEFPSTIARLTMEETTAPAIDPTVLSKSLQELAMEGQKVLEATVEAAHETLSSMNEVLCNPALWATSQPTPATSVVSSATATTPPSASVLAVPTLTSAVGPVVATSVTSASTSTPMTSSTSSLSALAEVSSNRTGPTEQEAGWAALDESRLRLRSSTSSLRTVITAIFNSPDVRNQENPSNGTIDKSDPTELEKLEKRVAELREEVTNKNKVVKVLIDELRDFISDISMWQSPSI